MNIMTALLLSTIICFQVSTGSQRNLVTKHDHTSEIADLLRRLHPIDGQDSVKAPGLETLQAVELRLTYIAEQSPEGRAQVIKALIKVVDDPEAKREWPIAHRWILAVDLLGYLRATEAIDALVANLDHTGENGIMSSIHFAPVNRALDNIGKPAVPQLIQALGSDQEEIRFQAALTLARIGKPALPSLFDALSGNQVSAKGGVAMVLAWIGGKDAKQAIQHAIEIESNEQSRRELEQALTEFNRRWKDQ